MRDRRDDTFGSGPVVNWRIEDPTRVVGPKIPANGVARGPMPVPIRAAAKVLARPNLPRHGGSTFYINGGKRVFDIAVVLLTLPFVLTLIAVGALALWIEGGNPFYRQDRIGKNGRVFRLLKLRTMTRNAESDLADILAQDPALLYEWNTTQKLKNDPRITPVGHFLRSTSFDELPQIWNVLRGEMSLVGPRPMMPDQLQLYGNPKDYFDMRPGLSGLWQIRDRNDSHFSYRASVDRTYRATQSVWLDLLVLWQTIFVVLRRTGH